LTRPEMLKSSQGQSSKMALYLRQGLRSLGLNLDQYRQDQLLKYGQELLTMAPSLGLSNLRDPKAVVAKHILDSLLVLSLLPTQGPILDLGTGAGLPGMVIKIVAPEREVWLVDARKKAVSFLHYVAAELGLRGLKIIHTRVGEGDSLPKQYFSVVLSRAVTSLDTLWEWAHPLLKIGGRLLALKGPKAYKEIDKLGHLKPQLFINRYDFSLPLLGDRRVIVDVRQD